MKKGRFFFIAIISGILGVASASWAQTGYRFDDETEAMSRREADVSVVKVHGPYVLTELATQAIQEKRPYVAVETHNKPLKNKVWIEGTTGADYMSLSPKRVRLMQAARDEGESVYSALCSEQKGVIHKTVGVERGWRRVEMNEHRPATRICYVRPICPPPPRPAFFVPPVNVGLVIGGSYPMYGYGAYGRWGGHRYPYYHGGKGYRSFHNGYRDHHASGSFHGGHK